MFQRVADHDTLKSGLSVSAAGRPAPVVPRRPGRGPPTVPTTHPARCGHPEPPVREDEGPRAHSPLLEPAPEQPPQTLTFVYCLSAFGVQPRGRDAGRCPRPRPGQRHWDSGGRRGAGPGAPPRSERGCTDARPPRRSGGACVLVARLPSPFPSESFGAGTSPRCAGWRAAEAAGRGTSGGVGLPAASPSGGRARRGSHPPTP